MKQHWLLDRLSEFGDKTALFWRNQQISYRQLLDGVNVWRAELGKRHLTAGESVALVGDYSPNTCMLLLALIANGHIVVPLTSLAASQKDSFLEIANVRAVFAFDGDDSWQFYWRDVTEPHSLQEQLKDCGEAGLILFTSGSTGKSKASLLNFEKMLGKFKRRRRSFRTLIFLLFDHIGGLNTLFSVLGNGGTLITPEELTPEEVCRAVERHNVQLLPTTPTFLNMLLISEAYQRYDVSSLEMITYGSEPMPESTLKQLHEVFPGVELKQTYGLSEVGIMATKSRDACSLWLKVGGAGYETKVVDGILWIRSESAMLGYLNAPSPFDAEGWFNTGDVVEVDGEYIRILGRGSEVINVGGEKIYPAEVENVLRQMENVVDATVWGKSNPVTGQVCVATVTLAEPEEPSVLEARMRLFCKDRLLPHKIPVILGISERFGHTERFKKRRSEPKQELRS